MIYHIPTEFYFLVITELKIGEDYHKARPVQPTLHPLICLSTVMGRRDREELQIVENVGNLPQNTENLDFGVESVEQRMSKANQQDLSQCFA